MPAKIQKVEDEKGNEKLMAGRPAGMRDFDIPKITSTGDLDWRCPKCGEVGAWSRIRRGQGNCVNMDCRVDKFSPFVDSLEEEA